MNAPLPLAGKRGLVTGIANADSIAWGCAKAFHAMGAELAVTYLNDKALPHVQPLAEQVRADMLMPLNLLHEGELEAVFERLEREWGALDFVLHSIAFAPREDLHGRVTDCSRAGFLQAMDVSCWSFIRMAAGRAADEEWRHAVLHELLRLADGGRALQHDGAGKGRAGIGHPLSGRRTGAAGHPRACDFAGAAQDPRGLGIAEFDTLLDRAQARRRRAAWYPSTTWARPRPGWPPTPRAA